MERLRNAKTISHSMMAERGIITPAEYHRICRSKTGPRVQTLDRLITGFGYTWHDWAEAFEAAKCRTVVEIAAETPAVYRRQKPKDDLPLKGGTRKHAVGQTGVKTRLAP